MTKEERLAARKKTMAGIVSKTNETIAKEKNKSSSAKEKRDKRNKDFSAKVKEVNKTRKAKQKAKDEKRIAARKKVVNKIDKGVNKTIARGKKQRADNIAKRKASYDKFRTNPKAIKSTTATKSKSATRAPGSEGFKPTDTRRGPTMGTVNKPDAKAAVKKAEPKTRRGPSGPSMTSMGGAKLKPRNKDPKVNLKKRGPSRPSMMGFRSGGSIDGCAKRGLTKAKGSS
tara:strand:- start:626 stop:1309 length:684 start_codon:yes stop_codon:yes gene_type:complete